ncbi:hypothetical protein K437DRAFT_258571 [Tilletiaria anomala UBC 951]|uniref:SH3 domain-containing protein n=1 Tax=Tilletiaria anomala (strain ATCC 24038 / CBS 436.72 / UBC 951) TaxID=1037660 RepID=A0A066VK62_TILAU|nr:uncharacterized protein K437DRAFT_258571 [Tilletiaria anomala UBC 951]KDN40703.1 hypothetical protein K437DRAFT_258571 [Tilletiaria anomala UBC 951]
MAQTATRPSLTLDVALSNTIGSRNQANKSAVQGRASAQAPAGSSAPRVGELYNPHAPGSHGLGIGGSGASSAMDMSMGGDDHGGFSSEDEGQDANANDPRRLTTGSSNADHYANGSKHYMGEESDSSVGEDYGQDEGTEQGSDDDQEYDEEDEDLSSSPSIPDENIDFDLVYALHNFVATVEGQATVHKGNSLTLLDDSNSYWWLVRVLRTQEVGYIPAENIETPFERLARLNKHRNVDLTSATDEDAVQVQDRVYTSHLIKSRYAAGISPHSGKRSALSRRRQGAPSSALAQQVRASVNFGPSTTWEHSGDEYSSDEEGEYSEGEGDEDEIQMDEDAHGEFDNEDGVSSGDDIEEDGVRPTALAPAQDRQQHLQQQQGQQARQQQHGMQPSAAGGAFSRAEPDDGMEWDSEATRTAQQQQQMQQQQQDGKSSIDIGVTGAVIASSYQPGASLQGGQRNQPGRLSPLGSVQPQDSQAPRSSSDAIAAGRLSASERRPSSGFLPSQVQAARDSIASSDTSTSVGRSSQDLQKDARKSANRKSKADDDDVSTAGTGEEKQTKKRSGVFSGLFSRNKDKKERKSGSFSGSNDGEGIIGRSSEDSSRGRSTPTSGNGAGNMRLSQQQWSRQMGQQMGISGEGAPSPHLSSGRPPRPGSLIGPPGSAPMLNVLRVFAGDDIHSDATFKTVLLNESTSSRDLVKQAMQRFRIGHGQSVDDYVLTVRLLEGDERILHPSEHPLQVFDALTETIPDATMPSVKRSSIGSISSVSSNLSLNPAIARLGRDFSDDHAVKFFLCRRSALASAASTAPQQGSTPGSASWQNLDIARLNSGTAFNRSAAPVSSDPLQSSTARFVLRLLIFPSDLPESLAFDPQTNAVIPKEVLMARRSSGLVPAEGISQQYREKILPFPRTSTVAEVIEAGLDRFGIIEGVVEGGDDVEERLANRRSKTRIQYGLSADIHQKEKRLLPNSRAIDAYPRPPILKAGPVSRDGRRRSIDAVQLLSLMEDIRPDDPIFILRQVNTISKSKTARSLSPTQETLVHKQEQQRQAELQTVAPQPSASAVQEATAAASPAQNAAALTRQEVIAAQRAAAKAAVLGAQKNDVQGLDVVLTNQARIRSSKSKMGTIRYSYIPVDGSEMDISAIIEEVLQDGARPSNGLSGGVTLDQRPSLGMPGNPRGPSRSGQGDNTLEDYERAAEEPVQRGPLSVHDAYFDPNAPRPSLPTTSSQSLSDSRSSTPQPSSSKQDLLETFVRDPRNSEQVLGDRIDQVLSRMSVSNPPMLSAASAASRQVFGVTSSAQVVAPPALSSYQSTIKATAPLRVRNLGVDHIYTLMDAATPKTSQSSHINTGMDILQWHTDAGGGLFGKPMPVLQDKKVREKYVALSQELKGVDESLDRILADVLRNL